MMGRSGGALLALAIAAVAGCAGEESPVTITMTLRHQEAATARAGDDLGAEAAGYLTSFDGALELGLSSDDGWEVMSSSAAGLTGLRQVRLQQIHGGVPVFGSEVIVRADDTTFLGFNGRHTAHLDGFDLAPALSAGDALALAKEDLAAGAEVSFSGESTRLVILPRRGGEGADLAWQVAFANGRAGEIEPGRWTYLIGAKDGAVLFAFDAFHTVEQGSGPGGNDKVSRTWTAALDVEPDGAGMYRMDTEDLITMDSADGDLVVDSMDLANLEDPVANDAHGFSEVTVAMLRDWMGRDSIDDAGLRIESHVHDQDHCPGAPLNACWDGVAMTYGDGGDAVPFLLGFYPFAGALDVVAHELHHGFTQFHSNLGYSGQPGGLNESFSDVAGTVAEFYHEGSGADFDVGEDVSKQDGMRFMCDPPADHIPIIGGSIDHMDDFTEEMDVHYSSGIGNRAFCLATARFRASSWGSSMTAAVQQVGAIWVEANAGYWTSGSSFVDACQGTVDAARALGFDAEVAEAVASSWADVGVVCDGFAFACDADGTCDAGDGETCASCAEDCGVCSEDCSFWKKAKCKLGIGDCSRCDLPQGCGDGACDGSETDESCAEDCGCAAEPDTCEEVSPAPFGCYCDDDCATYDDCCADVDDTCGG